LTIAVVFMQGMTVQAVIDGANEAIDSLTNTQNISIVDRYT
jgi:hypothetical protein